MSMMGGSSRVQNKELDVPGEPVAYDSSCLWGVYRHTLRPRFEFLLIQVVKRSTKESEGVQHGPRRVVSP